MKGHLTRLTLALSLSAAVAAPASALDLFGLFSKGDNSMESMLATVPADTPVFAGGHADERMGDFYDNWMMPASEADVQELKSLIDGEDGASLPAVKLFVWWLEDYNNSLSMGYDGLMDRYGIASDAAGVFYLDGAMPVMRIALDDEEAFWALMDEAASESGAEPRATEVQDVPVRLWRLTEDNAKLSLDLAVATHKGVATLTLFNGKDTPELMARRLGLAKLDQSMAKAGTWDKLGKTYGFDETSRMYLDIAALVESFMLPENTALGRDLTRLAPELMAETEDELDQVCRNEFVGLAKQAPRLVAGGETFDVTSSTMSQTVRLIWELKNTTVSSELQKLPGSLPTYATDASDKLLALAVGLDVNQLAPVATALWTQFTTAEFKCQQLVDMQTQAKATNPAMLGMASGMAQGVKGIGAALYSLEADPTTPAGLGGSALISVSAENPQTIASLITTSVPGMAGLNIPTTGEGVKVPVPVPAPPIYAAIKGKHLVVYTGDEAKAAADALANEPLNTKGLTAAAFNYKKFGEAVLTAVDAAPDASALSQFSPNGDCTEAYTGILQVAQMPMTLTYQDDYTERGWEALVGVDVSNEAGQIGDIEAGTYRTETLDYDCSWYGSGQETLNSDGSGQYLDDSECSTYRIDYQWDQNGRTLVQKVSSEQERDSCEGEWAEAEAQNYECTVLSTSDQGFHCLYHFDGEPTLMRYSLQ